MSVPDFRFIGYDDPTFEVAVEDNGILSWKVFFDSPILGIDPEAETTYEFSS